MTQAKITGTRAKRGTFQRETAVPRAKISARETSDTRQAGTEAVEHAVRRPGRPVRAAGTAGQREILLGIAVELFAQRGIMNTTLAEIAHAAGVTAAMMHYYFKSRDHLLDVLISERLEPIRERMIAALSGTDDPVEQLVGLARQMVQIGVEHSWYAPLWMREVLSEGGELRVRLEQRHGRGPQEAFIERLRRAQGEGTLNAGLEPELIVLSLMGLTLLPLAKLGARQFPHSPQIASETIAQHAVALLLGGVAGRKP